MLLMFKKKEIEPCSSIKIYGDSQVRGLSSHLPDKCIVNCYPGATVDRIDINMSNIQTNAGKHFIVHVGGNDIDKCSSEELKRKYVSLLGNLKNVRLEGKKFITVTGIIPRLNRSSLWYSIIIIIIIIIFQTDIQGTCLQRA